MIEKSCNLYYDLVSCQFATATGLSMDHTRVLAKMQSLCLLATKGGRVISGVRWAYNSIREWSENVFTWMSQSQTRRVFETLVDEGFLLRKHTEQTKWQRRYSYTVNQEAIQTVLIEWRKKHPPRKVNGKIADWILYEDLLPSEQIEANKREIPFVKNEKSYYIEANMINKYDPQINQREGLKENTLEIPSREVEVMLEGKQAKVAQNLISSFTGQSFKDLGQSEEMMSDTQVLKPDVIALNPSHLSNSTNEDQDKDKRKVIRNNGFVIDKKIRAELKRLQIQLDEDLIALLQNAHESQVLGALQAIDRKWKTINNKTSYFKKILPTMPKERLGMVSPEIGPTMRADAERLRKEAQTPESIEKWDGARTKLPHWFKLAQKAARISAQKKAAQKIR